MNKSFYLYWKHSEEEEFDPGRIFQWQESPLVKIDDWDSADCRRNFEKGWECYYMEVTQ